MPFPFSRCEHILVFPWDQTELLHFRRSQPLKIKNEGCLLEVFIMRLFNPTLSIYGEKRVLYIQKQKKIFLEHQKYWT